MEMMWEILLICLEMLGIVILIYLIVSVLLILIEHVYSHYAMFKLAKLIAEQSEELEDFGEICKEECKDWRTFAIMICVAAVVYFPTWGGYLLYAIG